jgi:C4-dicarboxylate transporter DctQ subunit
MSMRIEKIFYIYKQFLKYIEKVEFMAGVVILIIVVAVITINVFSRYVLNRPIVWAEELSVYGYIWIIFLGSSIALRQEKHIMIPMYYDKWPLVMRKIIPLITYLCVILILSVLLVQGVKTAGFQVKQHTISLPIRFAKWYFFALPLIVSVVSMIITTIYQIMKQVYEIIQYFGANKLTKFK